MVDLADVEFSPMQMTGVTFAVIYKVLPFPIWRWDEIDEQWFADWEQFVGVKRFA